MLLGVDLLSFCLLLDCFVNFVIPLFVYVVLGIIY